MSISTVRVALLAKIVSETGVTVGVANPLWRRHRLTAGDTQAWCLQYVAGYDYRDSNVSYEVLEVEIGMVHRLSDPTNEAVYTAANMLTFQSKLMNPTFWLVSGVKDVGTPELGPPQRIGNVIEFTVTAQLVIA